MPQKLRSSQNQDDEAGGGRWGLGSLGLGMKDEREWRGIREPIWGFLGFKKQVRM